MQRKLAEEILFTADQSTPGRLEKMQGYKLRLHPTPPHTLAELATAMNVCGIESAVQYDDPTTAQSGYVLVQDMHAFNAVFATAMQPEEAQELLARALFSEPGELEKNHGYRACYYPPEGVAMSLYTNALKQCGIQFIVVNQTSSMGHRYILLDEANILKYEQLVLELAHIVEDLDSLPSLDSLDLGL